jgi:hypothetical protein
MAWGIGGEEMPPCSFDLEGKKNGGRSRLSPVTEKS